MNVTINEIIKIVPNLNVEQVQAISETEGPLLIIAGPGTGKTLTMVLRTLYLLLSGKVDPSEIILTTFTEKAALELRDRVSHIARKIGYKGQLHELKVGTIHSLCNEYIGKFLAFTSLRRNYTVLDELTQNFFIYEHFNEIFGSPTNGKFLNKWSSKWQAIKNIVPYLNKITEELITPNDLISAKDAFLKALAECYLRYEEKLVESNRIDFSHLQKIFMELLNNPSIYPKIKGKIRYIMVDEYQDTNFIQEQIMLTLARPENNICVVGDDDQALYRFRGATVRNILEFKKHFPDCKEVKLITNYRSHSRIISAYNKFMNSIKWDGFKFHKEIRPNSNESFPEYPAIFCIWGKNEADEAERLAQMVRFLKENKIIQDLSQVGLLLSSVKIDYSKHYLDALTKYGIPNFAPRAKAYFENTETRLIIACYAIIFGFYGSNLNDFEKKEYIEQSILLLKDHIHSPLQDYIQRKVKQIEDLKEDESLDLTILDYFYQLLAYKPFSDFLRDENKAHNLAIFSQLLSIFQDYYNISLVSFKNRDYIKLYLFCSFFRFLLEGGMDEYEDPDNPIPKGYLQVMTIHQAKGLEFPVVIVGSLDRIFRVQKQVDRDLAPFSSRGTFETEKQMTEFDRMRHFYVAFSRAEKILVLTTSTRPQPWFSPIWDGLNQWPYVKKETLKAQKFNPKPQFIPKKSYSLSSTTVYETCPQQYLFYQEYQFQPSRSAQILFGSLVHQTIEDIHKWTLEEKLKEVDLEKIERWFEQNYRALIATGLRPISKTQKESALKQVINYYKQNQDILERIQEAEVDVSVEKEDYIIIGKIDLLLGKDGKLEILDFKTQPKPDPNSPIMDRYFKQLCLYAHILKERYGKFAERLFIYWTSEQKRKDAITEFHYSGRHIDEAGRYFDEIVRKISARDFKVKISPDPEKVCKECDFRFYCSMNGIIIYRSREL